MIEGILDMLALPTAWGDGVGGMTFPSEAANTIAGHQGD